MSQANSHIAPDGDTMEGPSDATATDKLHEIGELLDNNLITARTRLSELKDAQNKAEASVEQVGRFLTLAAQALEIAIPFLQAQLIEADEGADRANTILAENSVSSFAALRENLAVNLGTIGNLRDLVRLVDDRLQSARIQSARGG